MAIPNQEARKLQAKQIELTWRLRMIETRLGILYRPHINIPEKHPK